MLVSGDLKIEILKGKYSTKISCDERLEDTVFLHESNSAIPILRKDIDSIIDLLVHSKYLLEQIKETNEKNE